MEGQLIDLLRRIRLFYIYEILGSECVCRVMFGDKRATPAEMVGSNQPADLVS